MKYVWLFMAMALPMAAQQQRPLMPLVKDYLGLTTVQAIAIAANNDEYNRALMERQQRIRQVMQELAEETVKDWLEPAELAVRYGEIEMICRDLSALAATLRAQNLGVLDEGQNKKLAALEEAFKVAAVIQEAQASNLMAAPLGPPANVMGLNSGPVSLPLVTGGAAVVGACATPYQFGVLRKGDFQPGK